MRHHILGLILPLAIGAQQVSVGVPTTQSTPASAPAQAAETKPEDRGAVEGQVLNAATGEPVKKATLLLRRADLSPNTVNFPATYSTATDAAGSFAMKDIEPGKYRLSVNRTGFVNGEYGARAPMRPGTTLTLEPKQRLQGIIFRLTPHAVIIGRVLDEDREPVAYVQVQTMRYRYNQGRKQLMPYGGGNTNDLGEYRIFGLAPGRYYLSATYRSGMFEYSLDRSASQQPDEDYVPTYYPGTTDSSSAATVDVAAGAQVRGVDFTLSKTRTVRIKGRVNNATGSSRNNIMLSLTPRDSFGFFGMNRPTATDPKGNFEIRGIAPGSYTLVASLYDGNKSYSARQPIDAGSNIENLNVTIKPGIELTGQVRIDGPATVKLSDVRVTLRPRDQSGMMFGPTPNGQVKEDGTFTLSNASADQFSFFLGGLPDGFYVKSIRTGDDEVLIAGLDLSKGPAGSIDIVLSPNAGLVEGSVQNDKQQPAVGATVVLVPQEKERRDQMSYYKNVTTDQYGLFTVKNLDPGEYKVFAWEDVEAGAYMDPEFVKPMEGHGESVKIRESSRERLQLKLIPAETAQAGKPPSNN